MVSIGYTGYCIHIEKNKNLQNETENYDKKLKKTKKNTNRFMNYYMIKYIEGVCVWILDQDGLK